MMNKMGQIRKILYGIIFIIGLIVVINYFSTIVSPENIKINYVIPLPKGVLVTEIDYDMIQTIEVKYKEFVSKIPLIEHEIAEDSPFLIQFSINAPPQKYENLTLAIEHSHLLQDIQVSDNARNPLPNLGGDIFAFQKDLFPDDVTNLILTGVTSSLGDEPYSGANIKLRMFSHGEEIVESKDKTIRVCKENIEGGCSNKIKEVISLFNNVFSNNATINQTG